MGLKFTTNADWQRMQQNVNARYRSQLAEMQDPKYNQGAGALYLAEKAGLGALRMVEGAVDFVAGGVADFWNSLVTSVKEISLDDYVKQNEDGTFSIVDFTEDIKFYEKGTPEYEKAWAENNKYTQKMLGSDWVNYNHADEWYNPSSGWRIAGDVAGGIGSSIPMIALSFVSGGASLGMSFLGAAGSSMSDAYKETGKYDGSTFAYGLLSGATEAGVEALTMGLGTGTGKIINSLSKAGKGAVTAASTKVAGSFLKGVGKGAWSLTKDAISEGIEEGIASVMSPIYQKWTYNPDAKINWDDVLYESIIGAISGIFFGGAHGVGSAVSRVYTGATIHNKGKTDVWIGAAKELIAKDADTGGANTAEVRDALARFENATQKTQGEAASKTQQYLLGALQQSVMRKVVTPTLVAEGINAARNAGVIADYYNKLGGKDASGKAFHIDAADILEGIDVNLLDATDAKSQKLLAKQVEKMLKEGGALTRIAVVNAANSIMADTHKMAQGVVNGTEQITAESWNAILDRASDADINELAYRLGIDPRAATAEQVRSAVAAAMLAEQTSPKRKARLPEKIHEGFSQGAHRYTLPNGRADVTIVRDGDLFYLYDHGKGRLMTEALDIDAVNKLLADEAEWNAKKNVEKKEAPQSEADTSKTGGLNEESAKIAEVLRENVKQYSEASAKDRTTLRRIYRQAIAHGFSQQDAIAFAAVSARSGLNIVFDKARCIANVKDEKGKVVQRYARGFYLSERGTIVINPDAKVETVLIHELDHALRTKYEKGKTSVKIYGEAIKQVPDEKLASIIKTYEKVDTKLANKNAQYADEANAYYAEMALGNMDVLRYLVADHPSLKQRILSFFKKAAVDYAGTPKLDGYAKKYLKQYKKAFDQLSAQNSGTLALAETVDDASEAVDSGARYALSDALKTLGEYDATRIRHIESSGKDRVVRDYDEIIEFIKHSKTNPPFERLHIGIISDKTAALVKARTGEDIKGYDFVLASNFVFHIYDSHGNEATETPRGQKAVNDANIENIIETVIDPDDVSLVSDSTGTALRFEKVLEGRNVAITITSTKKSTLTLKSAWIINEKSGGRTPSANANALAGTPKANSRSSTDNSISKTAEKINPSDEKSSENSSETRYALELESNTTSDGQGAQAYSYEALTSKKNLTVVDLPDSVPMKDGRVDRAAVLAEARKNARAQEHKSNTEKETFVFVPDIGLTVRVAREGIDHGLSRNSEDTALATMKIGALLSGSVAVNELDGRTTRKKTTDMSYVLLAVAQNKKSPYLVRIVVDKNTNSLSEISTYGLGAVKAKKEGTLFMPEGNVRVEDDSSVSYLRSTISIADLLENVKSLPLANEVFSMDVLEKLGVARTKGTLSDSVRYALPLEDLTPAEEQAQEEMQRDVPRKKRAKKSAKERTEAKLKQYFSTEHAYEMLRSVYGLKDLSPSSIKEMSNQIWRALNSSVSADEKALIAWNTAGFILDRMMTTDLTKENPAAHAAMEELAYLRTGVGRLKFADTDVAELKHAFGKDGMAKIRGRWGYKGKGVAYPMEQFVVDIAREMPGMAYLEEMHPAEAFKAIMERYDTALEASKEKWISELDGATDIELDSIRNGLAQEILDGFDYMGAESSYARLEIRLETFRTRAERYKLKSELVADRAKAEMRLMRSLEKLRDVKVGRFKNATQPEMHEQLSAVFKALSKMDFRGTLSVGAVREQMRVLSKWYEDAKTNIIGFKSVEEPGLYNGDIDQAMLSIASKPDSEKISNQEIKDLFDIVSYFRNLVENYGKVWNSGRYVEAEPLAKEFIEKAKPSDIKIKNIRIMQAEAQLASFRNYVDDIGTVVARADGYREGGFYTTMHNQIREAELQAELARLDALAEHDAFLAKRGNAKYLYKAGKELVKLDGKQITKMHLISLYMTCKREQAWRGLALSGYSYTIPGTNLEQKFQDGLLDKDATDAEIAQFVSDKMAAIEKLLTKQDKEYVRILEKAYNGTLRDMKMRRDYERQGYSNVADGYYYPIRRGAMPKTAEHKMQEAYNSFNNSAFNKNTVEGAAQELVLENAESLFQRHVRAVSNYAHVGAVVDTFNILFNLDVSGNSNRPTSIQTETHNAWADGHEYFVNLFSDIKGTRMQSDLNKVLGAVRGKYAVAALAANAKVLFTQFSSLIASTNILDWSSLALAAKGKNKVDEAGLREVDRYCELARYRNADNSAAKAQGGIDGALRGVGEKLMAGIGFMDRLVVCIEWRACQVQIAKERGAGYEIGTEKNKVEAGKLLTKVIQDTQQSSLKSERTAAMRSPEQIMRGATMFTADAVKMLGRVISSTGEYVQLSKQLKATTDVEQRKGLIDMQKKAGKKIVRSVVALSVTSAYLAVLSRIFDGFFGRLDDEEDEEAVASLAHDFLSNFVSGIPIVKDVAGFVFDGFELSDMSFDAINNVLTSSKNIITLMGKENRTTQDVANGIKSAMFALSQMLGLPTRNLYNLLYGILNVTGKAGVDAAVGWRYEVDTFFKKTSLENDLKKAIERGDDVQMDYILDLIGKESFGTGFTAATRKELKRLAESGYTALPKSIGDTVTINGVEYKLTEAQQSQISRYYREALPSLNTLTESDMYKSLSIVDKEKAVEHLFTVTYDDALCRALDLEEESSVLTSRVIGAATYALYRVKTSRIESTVVNGVTVSGSKRRKTVAAINAMDISDVQKILLIYKSGYTVADGDVGKMTAKAARARLAVYLNTYKGDEKEKESLAKMCKMSLINGKFVANSE